MDLSDGELSTPLLEADTLDKITENDIDVIGIFLDEFKEYKNIYVVPEFGSKVTRDKLYDFIVQNK